MSGPGNAGDSSRSDLLVGSDASGHAGDMGMRAAGGAAPAAVAGLAASAVLVGGLAERVEVDGRRAWERLNGWHQDSPNSVPGHRDDGDEAMRALGDIRLVRGLLDQAAMVAVRTARRHGKSWAEVATMLGVTRQSAWEKWHGMADDTGGSDGHPGAQEVAMEMTWRQAGHRGGQSGL